MQQKDLIVEKFHKLFYENKNKTWNNTYWFGVPTLKNPLDLWVYQEILYETLPDVIVECGTFQGGSALFMATICEQLGTGRIITIDINDCNLPVHPRIERIVGDTVDDKVVNKVMSKIKNKEKVMVLLDSDHSTNHVFKELEIYSPLVSLGNYIIVEDTNASMLEEHKHSNPMLAVEKFLKLNDQFVVDTDCEKFYLTFNPGGYLKRVKL